MNNPLSGPWAIGTHSELVPGPKLKQVFHSIAGLNVPVLVIILALVFLLPGSGKANREAKIDSLKQLFYAPDDGNKNYPQLAYVIGSAYGRRNMDSSLAYLRASVRLYASKELSINKIRAHTKLASYLKRNGNTKEALEVSSKAVQLALTFGDSAQIAGALYQKGNAQRVLGQYEAAVETYQKGIRLFEGLGRKSAVGQLTINLGIIYHTLEENQTAFDYFSRAHDIFDQIRDTSNLRIALNNLGSVNLSLRDTVKAIAYFEQALEVTKQYSRERSPIFPLFNLGEIFLVRNDLDRARPYLMEGLDYVERHHEEVDDLVLAYIRMADYYSKLEQFYRAEPYLRKAMDYVERISNPDRQVDVLKSLVRLGEKSGNYPLAFNAQKVITSVRDTLLSRDNRQIINELNAKYQTEQREKELQDLKVEQERTAVRQRWTVILAAIFGILLVLIILLLLILNRKGRRFNKAISDQKQIIEQQNGELIQNNQKLKSMHEEKDALMGVVAHDLKAPLNNINGLLSVLELSKDDPDTFEKVQEKIKKVIRSGSNLIEELVLLSNLEGNKENLTLQPAEINTLVADSVETFKARAAGKGIELRFEPTVSGLQHPTHPEYLNRVLDNLISNAVKFSYSGTMVRVRLNQFKGGFEVRVKDQGPGIPVAEQPKLFRKFTKLSNRPTGGESSTGLGLSIVKQLVEKMGGSIDVESEAGKGATFIVRFEGFQEPALQITKV